MTHTHTPGPFPLHIQSNGERYAITTAQGNHFATTHDPSAARLIAAAPELLAALREMVSMVEEMLPKVGTCQWGMIAVENARSAIAKAERGEE